jgi:FkbM family methyltransferase
VVYSFGINYQISFEHELLERTQCTLRAFDPTISPDAAHIVDLLQKYPDRVTFEQMGLGSNDNTNATAGLPVQTLETIIKRNGDEFIDILKIDIEGYEFQVLNNIVNTFGNNQLPFGQLQAEFHIGPFLNKFEFLKKLVEWWTMLEDAGLRVFHREANLFSNVISQRHFVEFFEFSFLNVGRDHALLHGEIQKLQADE